MKRILLLLTVFGMCVMFCGCPYETTDSSATTGPLPQLSLNFTIACLGTSGTTSWKGTTNSGTQYIFTFGAPSQASQYSLTVKDTSGTVLLPSASSSCYCYFSTLNVASNPYTIMEVIQPLTIPTGSTVYNHLFAVVNITASSLNAILPFPSVMSNSLYQPRGGSPTSSQGCISGYLTYISGGGKTPPNTDALGYDGDSEIKTVTTQNDTTGSRDTAISNYSRVVKTPIINNTNSNCCIYCIVGGIVLLIIGIIFGIYLGRKKKSMK